MTGRGRYTEPELFMASFQSKNVCLSKAIQQLWNK